MDGLPEAIAAGVDFATIPRDRWPAIAAQHARPPVIVERPAISAAATWLEAGRPERLAAVTAYFNPGGSARRRTNFERFREALTVPLYAVDIPESASVSGIWQKERLLNMAVERLVPPEFDAIAWLDCDVLFTDPAWPERTLDALAGSLFVQPWSLVEHIDSPDPAWVPQASFASSAKGHPGYAWATHRWVFERFGLFDRCVVGGGGDTAMAWALTGRSHVPAWLEPAVRKWRRGLPAGPLGSVSGTIRHLYHGRRADRQYVERERLCAVHRFDPERHIAIDGATGMWKWSADCPPAIVEYMAGYYRARHEDD